MGIEIGIKNVANPKTFLKTLAHTTESNNENYNDYVIKLLMLLKCSSFLFF